MMLYPAIFAYDMTVPHIVIDENGHSSNAADSLSEGLVGKDHS